MPPSDRILPATVPLGILIRFKNSAATLPGVLAALRSQTRQPDLILGIDSGSIDGSPALLTAEGARILRWSQPYHHSRVLNFGLAQCPAERVLILSSHTVLESRDALSKLDAALDDPRVACASPPWDDDPFYSESISWPELQAKGLKLGSIYTNSVGLLRRQLWEQIRFDEDLPTMEDYAWAVDQVRSGFICRRVPFTFHYQRQGHARNFIFASCAFRLAARHGLRLRWLGRRASAISLGQIALSRLARSRAVQAPHDWTMHRDRLLASLFWRFTRPTTE